MNYFDNAIGNGILSVLSNWGILHRDLGGRESALIFSAN